MRNELNKGDLKKKNPNKLLWMQDTMLFQGHFSTRILLKSIMFYQKLCSQEIKLEGEMSEKNIC